MRRTRREAINRLKNVLLQDKLHAPANFQELIKRDVYNVLSSFMEIDERDVELSLELADNGAYKICVSAVALRLKNVPLVL